MIVGQASMTHMLLGILYMRKPREREKKKRCLKCHGAWISIWLMLNMFLDIW